MLRAVTLSLLLLPQLLWAQLDLNRTYNQVIADWLGVPPEKAYDGFQDYGEEDIFDHQMALFLKAAFEDKTMTVGDWTVTYQSNYSDYPAELGVEEIQVSQKPDIFQDLFTGIYLFLENSKHEKLVVTCYKNYFRIYFTEDKTALKDQFLGYFNDYRRNSSPYRGAILEFKSTHSVSFFSKSEAFKSDWDGFIYDEAKKKVIKHTIDSFLANYNYEKWSKNGLPLNRGILLYGPPGTGKSFIANVISSNIMKGKYVKNTTYFHIQARHIKTPSDVRNIYNAARLYSPSVLFFEDIDLIAGTSREVKPEVKNELMQQLSGLESLTGVMTIGTTNLFDQIDDALKRSKRLGYHFEIALPTFAERVKLLRRFLAHYPNMVEISVLADQTEGMSGADIKDLVETAFLRSQELEEDLISDELMNETLTLKRKTTAAKK